MKARRKSSGSSSRARSSKPAKAKTARRPAKTAKPAARSRAGKTTTTLDSQLFDLLARHAHEQVSFAYDPDGEYRGIVAIHNTTLGPALGGTRFWNYESDLDAVIDVLRLSRGMTCKAAIMDLPYGGGKTVVIGDPARDKTRPLLLALGRAVERLNGRYIIADDIGTSLDDLVVMRAMGEKRAARAIARSEAWRPWRAYAVMHMWRAA